MANDDKDESFEALCEEAHINAVSDRKLLKEHQKKLKEFIEAEGGSSTIVLATDALVKTADTLAKLNSQIIHLAELSLKKASETEETNDEEFDDNEIEEMYDSVAKVDQKVDDDEPN